MKKIVTVLLLLVSVQVDATLISANNSFFGDGSLTIDTSSGLAWLDLSITEGISFNDISLELDETYSGFRFASPDEVYALFVEAGIPDINDVGDFAHYGTTANAAPTLDLIDLLGATSQGESSGVTLTAITGFSSQHISSNGFDLIQIPYAVVREGVTVRDGIESFGEVFTSGSSVFPTNSYGGVGSWLVQNADVPEPSTISLLGLGLLGLVLRRKLV